MKLNMAKLEELKAKGIEQIASVVKSVYRTTYYHVVSIDDLIANDGNWIPAAHVRFGSGAHGRMGVTERSIDWSKTKRLQSCR